MIIWVYKINQVIRLWIEFPLDITSHKADLFTNTTVMRIGILFALMQILIYHPNAFFNLSPVCLIV